MTSATLEKPLTRESLVHPDEHLSTPEGSGLYAARTPRLPRIHANQVDWPQLQTISIHFQNTAHLLVVSRKKRTDIEQMNRF
jgi:hypothetical protein